MIEELTTLSAAAETSRPLTPEAGEMSRSQSEVIVEFVAQHVDEAAQLRRTRSLLLRAPDKRLQQLARLDERLSAHLDGIELAGACGVGLAHRALERPGAGEVFVATVRAIEDRDGNRLDRLLTISEALSAARPGLLSALGWVSPAALQGITTSLLMPEASPWRREAALVACAMHGVNPGPPLAASLRDADAGLRATALRVAGRCARVDLVGSCIDAFADPDPRCAFESARSALLLGDRAEAQATLEAVAADSASPFRMAALRLVAMVMPKRPARTLLAAMAHQATPARRLIQGVAAAGDPHYMPWLIAQMQEPKLARVAGEAFAFITGIDLEQLDLHQKPPEGIEFGPNDDPEDDDVAMDEDDKLPWPDPDKAAAWWRANGARFDAGTRYFMGAVPTPATCLDVLRTGLQRQRIAAADHLALLSPGTLLFNTAAPARRQQRLLSLPIRR